MGKYIPLFLTASIALFCQLVVCDNSFKGTIVAEYNQENLHLKTGIGLGPKKLQNDVFIMFYASWCPHCQRLHPTWIDFKKKHPQDQIIAVHCPDNHDLCETFSINGYPTLLLFSKDQYKLCQFEGQRNLEAIDAYWEKKCKGSTMREIPYRVANSNALDGEDDDEESESNENTDKHDSLDGNSENSNEKTGSSEQPPISEVESSEANKKLKKFKTQKNKGYEEKIVKFKDFLKKLGPLIVIAAIALCIFTITFVCNKCCFPQHEDQYTTKRRNKSGYANPTGSISVSTGI